MPHATTSPAIKARDFKGVSSDGDGDGDGAILVPMIARSLRLDNGSRRHNGVLAFDTTQVTSKDNRSNPQPNDPCHPLAAGAHPPAIAFDCKASGQNGFGVGEIASTQRAMGHAGSHSNGGGHQAVMSASQVRRLTPGECEKLMGFPLGYTVITMRGKPAADGPRYKALGNSWAVPVATWVGRRIMEVEGICSSAKNAA